LRAVRGHIFNHHRLAGADFVTLIPTGGDGWSLDMFRRAELTFVATFSDAFVVLSNRSHPRCFLLQAAEKADAVVTNSRALL
jgi:hypothetical protein